MRPFLPAIMLLGMTSSIEAQDVFGTLRLGDAITPASGAIVVATRVADQQVVARTITGERGTYTLRLGSDSFTLRVLRVGQRPFDLGTIQLRPGERIEMSATLANDPVVIQTMSTRVTSRCDVRPDGSATVALLFNEVRKALDASRLVSIDGVPTARYSMFTESRRARGALLGASRHTVHVNSSTAPFHSLSPESLSVVGYVNRDRDGGTVYYAPDATVLLADHFLAQHCLMLVDGPPEHPHLIGIGFEPVRRRYDIAQLRGTLMMDRASKELRYLDFSYVGLDPSVLRANPGGRVEYTRLDNGVWFASYWEIRMPRIASRAGAGAPSPLAGRGWPARIVTVDGVHVTGGEVLAIGTPAGLLYTSGAPDISADEMTDTKSPDLRTTCEIAVLDETLTAISGVVQDSVPLSIHAVEVRAEWTQHVLPPGTDQWERQQRTLTASADDSGRYTLCGVPRLQLVTVHATRDGRISRRVGVRVSAARTRAEVNLTLDAR